MKILNVGSCNIDYVYSIDHIVNPGETETTDKLSIFPGGKGLNQSIAISRAGSHVYHAGCFGNDANILQQALQENNVDLSYMRFVDEKNGHAIIQVNKQGENSIFLYPGSNSMVTTDYIDRILENFEKDDILLLQNEINNIKYIVERAYEKEMCIVLNPSPSNEKIKELDLHKLSYIILNEIELKDIFGVSYFDRGFSSLKADYSGLKIVLTLGEKGAVYIEKGKEIYQPIYEVNVVDTTAAGDTFAGYFISGIAQGRKISSIMKTASCASAISVSKHGAAPSIPSIHEVLSQMDVLKEKNCKDDILCRQIEKYIKDHIKNVSLEALAEYLGYSNVYMGNRIKKIFGKPFIQLVHDMRCNYAAELLLEDSMSVEEIIAYVGYENKHFFRTIFKRKFGMNPLAYKRNATQEIRN